MLKVEVVGIEETCRKIDEFTENVTQKFRDEFIPRLAEIGLGYLNVGLSLYDAEEPDNDLTPTTGWLDENTYELVLTSEASQDVLFFEFGTGVYNPPYQDQAVAVFYDAIRGEYGLGRGKNKQWTYYDSSGAKQITTGFFTDNNLYGSAREMRQSIGRVIKEVFA